MARSDQGSLPLLGGDLGSSNRPFLEGVPGVMAQRASLRDYTLFAVEKRRSNRTVYILRDGSRAA
jgi:hypothetical protein